MVFDRCISHNTYRILKVACCCFAAVSPMKRMIIKNLFFKNESLYNESCGVCVDCVSDTS